MHNQRPGAQHLERAIKWSRLIARARPSLETPCSEAEPQNPDTTWSGIGRTPKWVQAILDERGIDMAAFKSIPMYQIHSSS